MRPIAFPRDVETLCTRWAPLRYPILIRGERGTGKTHLARHIHRLSGRAGDFVSASLAEMSSGLELDRLLGHTRGSFTSAVSDHRGVLLRADRGTAFLDELGKASLEAQGALLGFLDHGRITPIGAERELSSTSSSLPPPTPTSNRWCRWGHSCPICSTGSGTM